jgi:LuxR family transcriptional regulator, maltose regulon positive regulatory protein
MVARFRIPLRRSPGRAELLLRLPIGNICYRFSPRLASVPILTVKPGGVVLWGPGRVPQATAMAERGPRSPRFPSSKFRVPKLARRLVRRSRLLDVLNQGELVRLAMVVGPAGAGKTMLLADWLSARPERPSAWLSCDAADAEPARFVAAIIEAVRCGFGEPWVGEDARQLMSLDGEVSADAVAALADDLEALDGARVLVIDDFHLAGAASADALRWLVQYHPPSLQLVVASRVDPPLRVHRMRAHQDLVELRDADLAFSVAEARTLLAGFDVRLDEPELTLVHQRSEGWVAGLQMAAISIHGSPDPPTAAGRVQLGRHAVAGYFLEEVLSRQPAEVVEFILATSVLDELSVPACTAVCGQGSAKMLERLYGAHMFVAIVDEEAGTYRYHHLIKEVLQAELRARDPAWEKRLHEAAARYLMEAGRTGPAARHLLAAGEQAAAFSLLSEGVVRDVLTNPSIGSALDLDEIRPELFAAAPEFLLPLAAELLWRGAFERGSRAVALARQCHIDQDRQPGLAVRLALVNMLYCTFIGQFDEALAHRERARPFEPKAAGAGDWIVTLDTLAMYCHTYVGRVSEARQLADALTSAQVSAALSEVLCPGVISQAAFIEGALEEAGALAASTLTAARRLHFDRHYFAFHALRTTALLAVEQCDLAAAADPVERALEMVSGARPVFNYLAQLDRARIWAAGGNLDEALTSLPAARSALKSDHSVLLAEADELEAHLRLRLGDYNGAALLAERLPGDRRMVMSAIIALAAGNPEEAAQALSALGKGVTIRSDLELRLLRASVAVSQSSPQAPALVRQALAVAERHGFVQTVVDTAPQLVEHVISNSHLYPPTEHLTALITAGLRARQLTASASRQGKLLDPLTAAEMRVLEKLPQRLTYAEMATELYLSLNTVKTHLRRVYMKLGATSRSSAIKRATSLGIL